MKKRNKILIAIGVLIVSAFSIIVFQLWGMQNRIAADHTQITHVDVSQVLDGRYEGSYSDFLISVHLALTVSGGKITHMEMIEQSSGPGYDALITMDEIITRQSPLVDSLSGATSSSKAIMNAAYRSLTQRP